jgi:signal transduction histidine kinase
MDRIIRTTGPMVDFSSPIRQRGSLKAMRNWAASRWDERSLATQFMAVGGIVALAAILIVGLAIRNVIENNFTRNAAATAALYVDSVIAPLLPDMRKNEILDETVARALDETLGQGALGRRLYSFRLWRKDGAVLYSNNADLTGRTFPLNDDLQAAFHGKMVARYGEVDEPGSEAERDSGQPFLEIYNPILQPWSGEVVAVSEFYEVAPDFENQLNQALLRSWVAVGVAVLLLFIALSSIVIRGSRTIAEQREKLFDHVKRLSRSVEQNELLSAKVLRASQKTSEINEQYLRRVAADLHDGPAQLLALAALDLESMPLRSRSIPVPEREAIIASVKQCVSDAMAEIRGISKGLMLPRIEAATLSEIIELAVFEHRQRTRSVVDVRLSGAEPELSRFEKIAIYRFIQETLNNGFHHAGGTGQLVRETSDELRVMIEVSDQGRGFDQSHESDGMGLIGLRERIESLGGVFGVTSSTEGTKVMMSFERRGRTVE